MVPGASPSAPWRRVTSWPSIVPTVRLTLRTATLPRTSSGKLSRAKARNLYLNGEIKPYALAA